MTQMYVFCSKNGTSVLYKLHTAVGLVYSLYSRSNSFAD